MAIDIKVQAQNKLPDRIDIKVGPQPDPPAPIQAQMELNARKSVDGNVLIFDHKEIDIVVMPSKSKIVAFPKDMLSESIYEVQDRLFSFLSRKGVIDMTSIQGGSVFMSMEAMMPQSDNYNVQELALFSIAKFIEEEKPVYKFDQEWEDKEEKRLSEPPPGEYTEFDPEQYHSVRKGSVRPDVKYGISSIYRLE